MSFREYLNEVNDFIIKSDKEIDSNKYIIIFDYFDVYAEGITGTDFFQTRLYGFDSSKEAKKYQSTFVKFMKNTLGKSVGSNKYGTRYSSKISDVSKIIKIKDIGKDSRYPNITYYEIT